MGDNNVVGSTQASPSASNQEKETTSERKDLAEALPDVATDGSAFLLSEFPRSELLKENLITFQAIETGHDEPHEEHVTEVQQNLTWDDPLVRELEICLLSYLFVVFQCAVKDLSELTGYGDDIAELGIMMSGLYHGRRDVQSNIVAGGYAILESENVLDTLEVSKPCFFENIVSLVEYLLLEMICILREVMPSLTIAEAMWSLVICDMNLYYAWLHLLHRLNFSPGQRTATEQSKPEASETGDGIPNDKFTMKALNSSAQSSQAESSKVGTASQFCKSKSPLVFDKGNGEKNSGANRKGMSKRNILQEKTFDSPGMLPLKDTVLALPAGSAKPFSALAPELKDTSNQVEIPSSSRTPDYFAGIPYDKTLGKYVARDEKDEMILALVSRIQALQQELQGWANWGTEVVMLAAGKLKHHQLELNLLRQERKESTNLKQQTLPDMEHRLSNVNKKIDSYEANIDGLRDANDELRQVNEAAKMNAHECMKSLLQARLREQKAQENMKSCYMEKGLMQEEFTALEHNAASLEGQLKIAKGRLDQFEALRKDEETEKLKIISKLKSIRKEREQQEALAKSEEDDLRQKSECKMQKYREEIERLAKQISLLKFESQSSKLAANQSGIGMESSIGPTNVGLQLHNASRRLEIQDKTGAKRQKPERECVMCLMKERSVVFLPCSHQVLCTDCNELHKKHGIDDCPFCRTLIDKRIQVRFANS